MRRTLAALVVPAPLTFAAGVAGCSNKKSGTELERYCARQAACGIKDGSGQPSTQASCEAQLAGFVPPAGCADAAEAEACADWGTGGVSSPIVLACTPPCQTSSCSSDQTLWTYCAGGPGGQGWTYSCDWECSNVKQTFSGVCGTSFNGKTVAAPQCWCQ